MKRSALLLLAISGASLLSGCDGQQYVSPSTVALIVTDADDGDPTTTERQRVNRCHYVPVLLGSKIHFRYEVDDELRATFVLTRDDAAVAFEPEGTSSPFYESTSELEEDGAVSTAPEPPEGYEVTLESGCTPDDEYR